MSNIKLIPPAGFDPYGGTSKSYQPSADGAHFFSQCGRGPQGFGQYVFRQVGNNPAQYVNYGPLLAGRGVLCLGGNGKLYVVASLNDQDELAWAFEVPGFVPFTSGGSSVPVEGGSNVDLSAIEARIAAVETLARQANDRANYAAERANYVKGLLEPIWQAINELRVRPVGISRDEAWQIAADRTYVEVSNPQSGVAGAILALVRSLVGEQSTESRPVVDSETRAIAEAALAEAREAKADSATRVSEDQAKAIAQQEAHNYFEALWQRFVSYTDRRLYNVIWDRGVRLLEYAGLVQKGKLPVNSKEVRDR